MPELPEIETVRMQLAQVLVGKRIKRIDVLNIKSFQGKKELVEGKKVLAVQRRAKVLLIDLEGAIDLAFHFKMSGQLVYVDAGQRIAGGHPTGDFTGELPSKHTRVVFHLDQGKLYFNDQRKFGWVKTGPKEEIANMKFLLELGPEPFVMDEDKFLELFKSLKKPIKVALMDQKIISGVGNIYANDALWEAGIRPDLASDHLTFDQLILLFNKLKMVLREGIKYGGATAADAKYMNLHGLGGHYQDHFRTYGREGQECLRKDGGKIEKVVLGGRGTFFCPVCQK